MEKRTAATAGGGGHPEIDFNLSASPHVGLRVEPKVCEFCGRQFFRCLVARRKYCDECEQVLLKTHLVRG